MSQKAAQTRYRTKVVNFGNRRKKLSRAFSKLKADVKKNSMMLKNTVEDKQMYRETSQTLADNSFNELEVLDGLAQGIADTATGSTASTGARIGNSINVKTLSLRMVLDGTRYAADPANPNAKSGGIHRIIVYNSPCGEALNAQALLRETSSAFTGIRSHYNTNVAQGKMYEIWYDKVFHLSDAKPSCLIKFIKKWKNGKKVIYDNNTVTPSNFRPKVLVISDNVPPGATNDVSFSFKCKYEDL
jgi:hypothetical protein